LLIWRSKRLGRPGQSRVRWPSRRASPSGEPTIQYCDKSRPRQRCHIRVAAAFSPRFRMRRCSGFGAKLGRPTPPNVSISSRIGRFRRPLASRLRTLERVQPCLRGWRGMLAPGTHPYGLRFRRSCQRLPVGGSDNPPGSVPRGATAGRLVSGSDVTIGGGNMLERVYFPDDLQEAALFNQAHKLIDLMIQKILYHRPRWVVIAGVDRKRIRGRVVHQSMAEQEIRRRCCRICLADGCRTTRRRMPPARHGVRTSNMRSMATAPCRTAPAWLRWKRRSARWTPRWCRSR